MEARNIYINRIVFFKTLVLFCSILITIGHAQNTSPYTTSGSWTCPQGVTTVKVEAWGGGAGGRSSDNVNNHCGGGGGGGAYAIRNSISVVPGTLYSFTIGAGGTAANGNTSTAGGTTTATINGVTITAVGGGSPGASGMPGTQGTGGNSASCIGDNYYSGGNGAAGSASGSNNGTGGGGGSGAGSTGGGNNASTSTAGTAKSSNGGAGGNGGLNTTGTIASSTGYGGGGGGGGHKNNAGGAGRTGGIIFTYTCPTASAGDDQDIGCSSSTTLAGNAPSGTGTWTVISGAGTFANANLYNTTVTNIAGTTNTYRWTITNSPCPSSADDVIITSTLPTTSNAGTNSTITSSSTNLAGNTATYGTGTWTLLAGTATIVSPNSATSSVTGLKTGVNVFRWTIVNGGCTSSSEVRITAGATSLFSEGFEGCTSNTGLPLCNWTYGTFTASVNSFGVSTTSPLGGTKSLTVHNGATLNTYNKTDDANRVAYYTVPIDATNYSNIKLNFKWKCTGEIDADYGRVMYSFNGSSWYNFSTKYQGQATTQTVTDLDLSSLDGTSFYIGFQWINNATGGSDPPFTVDDISITGLLSSSSATWLGEYDTNMEDPANWSSSYTPNYTTDVTISTGSSNSATYSGTSAHFYCRNLTIEEGVTFNLTTNNGSVKIYGDLLNNGTINHTGTLYLFFHGSGKTISGTGNFYGGTICPLRFSSGSSYTLGSLTGNQLRASHIYIEYTSDPSQGSLSIGANTLSTHYFIQEGTFNQNSGVLEIAGPSTYTMSYGTYNGITWANPGGGSTNPHIIEARFNAGTGTTYFNSGDFSNADMFIENDQTIKSATYNNLKIRTNNGYTSTLGSGSEITVAGNLEIFNTSTAGGVATTANDITLNGDFTFGNTGNALTLNLASRIARSSAGTGNLTMGNNNDHSINITYAHATNWAISLGASGATSPLTFYGNVTYNSASDQKIMSTNYKHLTLNGGGTKDFTANTTISGNLTLTDGILDPSSSHYNISLAGNYLRTSGSFTQRNNTLTLNGSDAQTLNHGASWNLYNLTVNNTHEDGITISNNINLVSGGIATLTDGKISTGANTLIVNNTNSGSVATGGSNANYANSWVNGTLRRYIANETNGTYEIPVGTNSAVRLAKIEGASFQVDGGTGYLEASFNESINCGGCGNSLPSPIATDASRSWDSVDGFGEWQIEASGGGVTSGTYSMYLFTNGTTGLESNNFTILKRPHSSATDNWALDGTFVATTTADGYAKRTNMTSFSFPAIGKSSTPLPIKLVDFSAKRNDNKVELDWTTSSETNNDYFTIEKSKDGKLFDFVSTVNGAGNSNSLLNYSIFDYSPFAGTSYYRLKQTDFDGKFEYSKLISVDFNTLSERFDFNLYPNPLTNYAVLNVKLSGVQNDEILVVVQDLLGKEYYSKVIVLEEAEQVVAVDPYENLSPGIYMVTGSSKNSLYSKKLVVK